VGSFISSFCFPSWILFEYMLCANGRFE
jgi:hypothetical protein